MMHKLKYCLLLDTYQNLQLQLELRVIILADTGLICRVDSSCLSDLSFLLSSVQIYSIFICK